VRDRGTLARVRRAGLIAAGALGAVAVAALATWLVVFRDTAEPVAVGEVVKSFRDETESARPGPSPIPGGVYVYATRGFETTDALTGVRHRYPPRSTITVAPHACGVRLTWQVLEGRSTEWVYCVGDEGWELRSQDERHTFFGRTERTTYVCTGTPIRPNDVAADPWSVTCSTDGAVERGSAELVSLEAVRIGGRRIPAEHVRKTTTISGDIRGTARHDLWFASDSGVPVKVVMTTRTTNDSPIGDVTYEEAVTLRLLSLEPRR
jgi:hypothetical protein